MDPNIKGEIIGSSVNIVMALNEYQIVLSLVLGILGVILFIGFLIALLILSTHELDNIFIVLVFLIVISFFCFIQLIIDKKEFYQEKERLKKLFNGTMRK